MGVKDYFFNVKNTAVTIFEGMTVTFSHLLRRPITVQYPDKTPEPIENYIEDRFRGILEVDLQSCIGCLLCMKACPLNCIYIEVDRDPELGRVMTQFDIDEAKCMYCGLCTEACPTQTLRHTKEFELSTDDPDEMVLRFIEPGEKVPFYKPQKGVEPPRRPLGEILRKEIFPQLKKNREYRDKGREIIRQRVERWEDREKLIEFAKHIRKKAGSGDVKALTEVLIEIIGDADFSHQGYNFPKELATALATGKERVEMLDPMGWGSKYLKKDIKLALRIAKGQSVNDLVGFDLDSILKEIEPEPPKPATPKRPAARPAPKKPAPKKSESAKKTAEEKKPEPTEEKPEANAKKTKSVEEKPTPKKPEAEKPEEETGEEKK